MLKDMIKSQAKMAEGGQMDQKTIMKLAKKYAGKMKY
jgi:hypothetical protein